ncbi:MAG: DUF4388 domain-containing protein [Acidobacteriota bacterium]
MRGDLTKDCLPDVIRRIYLDRRSGSLRLTQDHTRKEIFFELGAMVFASSNRKEDRIGETMLRHGTLSKDDFEMVQSQMGRGKRFGKVLLDLKLITERDLIANVTFQVLDIIYSLFNWTLGQYQFIEIEKSISDDLRLELSTASIILEGVRRIDDFDVIQRGLGDLNRLLGPSTNPLLRLQSLALKPLERQLIDIAREPVGLLRLLVSVKAPAESVLRSLYGLLSAGILERFSPPEISRASGKFVVPAAVRQQLEQEEPIPIVPTTHKTGSPTDEATLRQRVEYIKLLTESNDPYLLLGVTRDVTKEDLYEIYCKLAREFHPDRFLHMERELRTEVDAIFIQLRQSYELLRTSLQSSAIPIIAPITDLPITLLEQEESAPSLPIPLTTATETIDEVLFEPLEESANLNATQPLTQDIVIPPFANTVPLTGEGITRDHPIVNITPVETPRERRTLLRDHKGISRDHKAVAKESGKHTALPAQQSGHLPATSSANQVQAEQLFLEGRSRFQAKDLISAIRCLREAVQLDTTQARYRLLLGHILSSNQRWHKEAEEQFRRVLETDPYNAMAHVGLGQLYTKVGLIRRAEGEFRAALKLDPENTVALKGLQGLKSNDPSTTSTTGFLAKLFPKK